MSGRSRAAVLLAAVVTLGAVLVPSAQAAPRAPDTAVLDGARLQQTKLRLDRGDPQLHRALRNLTTRADNWLDQGTWTVVDKPKPAPGGDVHDYLSQAPYWWPSTAPTADNPWGCPYVQRDGQRNPEVDSGTDRQDVEKVFDSTYDLSLAWYYTGRRTYAEKAAQVLRTWFLAPATRMNPNLNHAQFIPCKYDGRAIGIIDFSQSYTSVVDALAILGTGAPGWTKADRKGMTRWNSDFLGWLKNSGFGREEGAAANNHGTFYDMQLAALAYATGDRALARRTVLDARAKRIDPQITGDGSQPQEPRPHAQLALLDLRPGRVHPARGDRPARRRQSVVVSRAGRTGAVEGPGLSAAGRDRGLPMAAPGAGVPPLCGERCRPGGGGRGGQGGAEGGAEAGDAARR